MKYTFVHIHVKKLRQRIESQYILRYWMTAVNMAQGWMWTLVFYPFWLATKHLSVKTPVEDGDFFFFFSVRPYWQNKYFSTKKLTVSSSRARVSANHACTFPVLPFLPDDTWYRTLLDIGWIFTLRFWFNMLKTLLNGAFFGTYKITEALNVRCGKSIFVMVTGKVSTFKGIP